MGALKHGAHGFDIDHEGKDSWRMTRAGASPVVISSPGKIALVEEVQEEEPGPEEIVSRFMGGADLVVVEGFKGSALPKVEVHREERSSGLICVDREGRITDERLIAVVSDGDLSLPVPVLPLEDPVPLCDLLEERFLRPDA